MTLTVIDLKNSDLFYKAWELYETSFPKIERRNIMPLNIKTVI